MDAGRCLCGGSDDLYRFQSDMERNGSIKDYDMQRAVAYARTYPVCTAIGNCWSCCGLEWSVARLTPEGRMLLDRYLEMFIASSLEKIEPNTATPKELPMERKNVTPEVAAPRSRYCTAFCTTMVSTCITMPRPNPSTNMYASRSLGKTDRRHRTLVRIE